MINFASDNLAPAHPSVIKRMEEVNTGAMYAYGDDPVTLEADMRFKDIFGSETESFIVFNGTGANTVALDALTDKYHMIITPHSSHITADECGSPARTTGCAIGFLSDKPEKARPEMLERFISLKGDVHKSQPKVLSISQATEIGEIYTLDELKALRKYCDINNLCMHMDGARLCNAAARLNCSLKEAAYGADILSFGLTKNGGACAEAVVALNPEVKERLAFLRKQNAQLASKMRYFSAQFLALFENDLWLENAIHANDMLDKLLNGIKDNKNVKILYPAEANMLFAELDTSIANRLLEKFYFYPMRAAGGKTVVRLMASWNTTEDEVDMFIKEVSR